MFVTPAFRHCLVPALSALAITFSPLSLLAQEIDEAANARAHVNVSGKLRMLSQRVAAEACNYAAGVSAEDSQANLAKAQADFSQITQALKVGDAELGVYGKEERRKTLEALAAVQEKWELINVAVDNLLQNKNIDQNLASINELNTPLLNEAKKLVSEISAQYSDPFLMMQSDAMLVDISGRQRMLSQKMAKEACLHWSGLNTNDDDLAGTAKIFETSLQALREGLEAAGVKPAPTPEIKSSLDEVWEQWIIVKSQLQKAISNEEVALTLREDVSKELSVILVEMDEIVEMYTANATSNQ